MNMLMIGLVPSGSDWKVALLRPAAPRDDLDVVAAEAAATEITDLENADTLIEAQVVEEIVRVIDREEQRRRGGTWRVEGKSKFPLGSGATSHLVLRC